MVSISIASAKMQTEQFKVRGVCSMCENRLEKLANNADGVSDAIWDKKTQIMTISFENTITSIYRVQRLLAESGHDTDFKKANTEAYDSLPECCRYEKEIVIKSCH